MRIEYGDASFEIEFNGTGLVFGKDCALILLKIRERVYDMPEFELELFAPNFYDYLELKNMTLIYNSVSLNYRVPLGILEIKTAGQSIKFRGYLCTNEFFRDERNLYLGNSVKTAIQQKGLREKIVCDNDFSYDIHQFSCSDMDEVIGLCNVLSSTPYWSISRTSIILKDSEIVDSQEAVMSPSSRGKIRKLQGCDIEGMQEAKSPGGKYQVFGSSRYIAAFNSPDQTAAGRNYEKNITAQYYTPEFILVNEYGNEFNYPAGTKFKNYFTNFSSHRFWTALSVDYTYTTKGRSSTVTWAASDGGTT